MVLRIKEPEPPINNNTLKISDLAQLPPEVIKKAATYKPSTLINNKLNQNLQNLSMGGKDLFHGVTDRALRALGVKDRSKLTPNDYRQLHGLIYQR